MIGVVALVVWGFVSGLLVCAPLALLFHNLQRSSEQAAGHPAPAGHLPAVPVIEPDLGKPEVAQPSRSFR
jgi:hypothetical protein